MKKFSYLFFVFIFITPIFASTDSEIARKNDELKKIEKDIKYSLRQKNYLKIREGKILSQLSSLNKKVEKIGKDKREIEKKIKVVDKELVKLGKDIEVLEKNGEIFKKILGELLKNAFVNSEKEKFDEIMPNSKISAERNYKLLLQLGRINYILLTKNIKSIDELTEKIKEREEKKKKLKLAYLNKKILEKRLYALKIARRKLLKTISAKKSYYIRLVQELNSRKKKLSGFIEKLQKERKKAYVASVNFSRLRGDLIWPVAGKLYKNYGKEINRKYHTVVFNDGIDILAKKDSSVFAVASGRVVYAAPYKNYGNMVIIDHGKNYYTIYANLSSLVVKRGNIVSVNSKIGSVGLDVITGLPLLHFEVRHASKSISPIRWLKKLKR